MSTHGTSVFKAQKVCKMSKHPEKDAQTPTVWWHFKWIEDLLGELLGSVL